MARFWLPVAVWAALIFYGSGDVLSDSRTSRFLGPLLRWVCPDLSDTTVRQLQGIVRKGGHVTEYAILALLALRALMRSPRLLPQAWSWRAAFLALALCVLYAASDEFHQALVPSRYGSGLDVAIDAGGAILGLGLAWLGTSRTRQGRAMSPGSGGMD